VLYFLASLTHQPQFSGDYGEVVRRHEKATNRRHTNLDHACNHGRKNCASSESMKVATPAACCTGSLYHLRDDRLCTVVSTERVVVGGACISQGERSLARCRLIVSRIRFCAKVHPRRTSVFRCLFRTESSKIMHCPSALGRALIHSYIHICLSALSRNRPNENCLHE